MKNYYKTNTEPTTLISYSVLLDDQVNTTTNTETFDDFVEGIKDVEESDSKEGGAFAPFIYKDNYRNKKNATYSNMLVFDVDNLPESTTAKDLLSDFGGYRVICYTSYSHLLTGKGARFRIIFLLSKSIGPKEYEAVARNISETYPALKTTDSSGFIPSQMFYLPKMPTGRLQYYEFAECHGEALDWEKFLTNGGSAVANISNRKPAHSANILEGSRNATANKYAFALKIDGFADELILTKTLEWNSEHCTPPLPRSEIEAICRSVAKVQLNDNSLPSDFSEFGISKSLLAAQGKFLTYLRDADVWYGYCKETGLWEKLSSTDIRRLILQEIDRLISIYEQTGQISPESRMKAIIDLAKRKTASFQKAVEKLMPTVTDFLISSDSFNKDKLVFGLPNSRCFDLKTIEVRDTQPGDYLTQSLGVEYDPEAQCPLWLKSIEEWTCGDTELANYLQAITGYSLSGMMTDHKLYFLFGGGRNGKSVFINTISKVYASYATSIDPSTLMDLKKSAGQASSYLARLAGYRVVTCNELPRSGHLNEELVKRVTAGDAVVARMLHENEIEFRPEFKIFMSGNDKPVIQETTDAIWSRMPLIPFKAKITKVNLDLEMQLTEELPGILNWMIEGWRQFVDNNYKLELPEIVVKASNEYREEMDVLGTWKDSCIVESATARLSAGEAYACYKSWADRCSMKPMTAMSFSRQAPKYLGPKLRDKNGFYYQGFRINQGWVVETY